MKNINIELVDQQLTKLHFDLDGSCNLCKRGLRKILKMQKMNINAYGSKVIETGKLVGKVELLPDYNGHGILTHWHIR